MDGSPPAGRVLAVDHDRLFKELLTTFFFEFLDLFFPRLAAQLDRESIEFLSQELFPDLLDGAEYQADILVKARFRGQDAYFLIHVEHQSEAPATFPRRFFRYFSAIFSRRSWRSTDFRYTPSWSIPMTRRTSPSPASIKARRV
jgi:predicted transposase/invertase (TIGR01784 family)